MKQKIKGLVSALLLISAGVILMYLFVMRFTQMQYTDVYYFWIHIKEFLAIFVLLGGIIFINRK